MRAHDVVNDPFRDCRENNHHQRAENRAGQCPCGHPRISLQISKNAPDRFHLGRKLSDSANLANAREKQFHKTGSFIRVYSCSFVAKICGMPNEPNPFSDRIHIEQLEISARIGVPEKERATPQRLTVSISFWPYYERRDLSDKIDNAVNYSTVVEETKNFVRKQSTNLIETL